MRSYHKLGLFFAGEINQRSGLKHNLGRKGVGLLRAVVSPFGLPRGKIRLQWLDLLEWLGTKPMIESPGEDEVGLSRAYSLDEFAPEMRR